MAETAWTVHCEHCGKEWQTTEGTIGQQVWCSPGCAAAWLQAIYPRPYDPAHVRELIDACTEAHVTARGGEGTRNEAWMPWGDWGRIVCALEDLNGGPDGGAGLPQGVRTSDG